MIHGKSEAEHLGAFTQGGVSNFIRAQGGHSRAAEILSSHTSGTAQGVTVTAGLRRSLEQ